MPAQLPLILVGDWGRSVQVGNGSDMMGGGAATWFVDCCLKNKGYGGGSKNRMVDCGSL